MWVHCVWNMIIVSMVFAVTFVSVELPINPSGLAPTYRWKFRHLICCIVEMVLRMISTKDQLDITKCYEFMMTMLTSTGSILP